MQHPVEVFLLEVDFERTAATFGASTGFVSIDAAGHNFCYPKRLTLPVVIVKRKRQKGGRMAPVATLMVISKNCCLLRKGGIEDVRNTLVDVYGVELWTQFPRKEGQMAPARRF